MFIIFLILFRRDKYVYQNREYHPGDIPEDCTPAVAAYLTNALVYDKYIFATILDLVRKGYLKISKAQNSNEQAEDEYYIISQLKEVDDCLLSHEKFFINMLINEIGNGHSVSTSEIQRFSKDNGSKFSNLFSEWRRKIKEDVVSKGYYDKSKTEYGVICILSFVVLFIVSISALVKGILYGIAGIIISSVLFIYGLVLLNRLTDYGHSQYKKWKEFKKYMKGYNIDLSKENINEYSSDITLIYALGLGIDEKIRLFNVDKIVDTNEASSYNSWLLWYLLLVNNDNNSFKKSMNKSFSNSNASYSGSSSFTGGGGGGAGGGGAGGF